MQRRTTLLIGTLLVGTSLGSAACDTTPGAKKADATVTMARQIPDARDGSGGGTTGGSKAADDRVITVNSRASLVKALGGENATNAKNDTPKIVLVDGDIDLRTDDAGKPTTCESFAVDGFSYDAYLKQFDPETFGRKTAPSGPLEDARLASEKKQGEHTKINVGSNTTIFGLNGAKLRGGTLYLDGVSNVIVRNLDLSGASDCFPLWDATDGEKGSFNSEFDNVSILHSDKIWIDHNAMSDGGPDIERAQRFGVPFDVYDGLVDITEGATDVTVSYNDFANHDKGLLIGSSDKKTTDKGKLAVTLHHNRFAVGQRAPRVRFGQVDVYNNVYVTDNPFYEYLVGVGLDSHLVLENNVVTAGADQTLEGAIENLKGTRLTEKGTMVQRGTEPPAEISLLAAYNEKTNDPKITEDAGWTPTQRLKVDPAADVLTIVEGQVGPGRLIS